MVTESQSRLTPDDGRLRIAFRSTVRGAAEILCVWTALLLLTGGFDATIAGLRIRAHDPFRPMLYAAIAWVTFILAGGRLPGWARAAGRTTAGAARMASTWTARVADGVAHGVYTLCRASVRAADGLSRAVIPADGRAARWIRAAGALLASATPSRWIVPAMLMVAFLPAWSSAVVPSHDALQVFTAFWTYISGLVTEGRLPEWIPFGRYGTPSGPTLIYITPVAYVTGAIGAALHAAFQFDDTLLLFKLTVLVEYLLFATGLLRFGRLLFQSVWVQYLVVTLGVLSSPWIMSLDGNFHAFYMTPWILASLMLAFQTGLPKHLGAAALLSAFACVGNVPYFSPFLLLQLTVFALPLIWCYPQQARRLVFSPQAWLWLAGAGVVFAIHFVVLVKGMDGLAILSPGRDPVTNHVPKAVFLTYAGVTTPVRFLVEVLTGRVTNGDNTFYVGLGSLVLLPLSLLIRTSPVLRAVQFLAVFLFLFSTGGLVASAGYYFPGMEFYRHVSIVFGLFRVLVFLCVGCVLDQMIRDAAVFTDWRRWSPRGWGWLIAAGVAGLAIADLTRAHLHGPDYQLSLFGGSSQVGPLMVRLVCYATLLLIARAALPRTALPYLLMMGLLVDMGTFWGWGWADWPRLTAPQVDVMRQLAAPKPVPNPESRYTAKDETTRGALFRFVSETPPLHFGATELYVHTYSWTGEDPCVPRARTDFIAKSVAELFDRRGILFEPSGATEAKVLQDEWLARALACDAPKITSDAHLLAMERGYDWMRMTFDNPQPASTPVIVSEAFHPDWSVSVDGLPSAVVPGNIAFLGTDIPAGRHQVEFRFHSPVTGPLRTVEGLLGALAALWLIVMSLDTVLRP
jgi:hypothetical protein